MDSFGRSVPGLAVKGSSILAVLLTLGFVLGDRAGHIAGLWAGTLWIATNVWLIRRILKSVTVQKPGERKRVYAFAVVKFPVLYVAGLFLLLTPWVTLEGVFAAFTLFFVSTAAAFAFAKFRKK